MPLRNLLKKGARQSSPLHPDQMEASDEPQFTFLRTTTTHQETISPPSFPGDSLSPAASEGQDKGQDKARKSRSLFKKHSHHSLHSPNSSPGPSADSRSLGERLHLKSSRSASSSSVNLPQNLPDAPDPVKHGDDDSQWEQRATLLAKASPMANPTPSPGRTSSSPVPTSGRGVSDPPSDVSRQPPLPNTP